MTTRLEHLGLRAGDRPNVGVSHARQDNIAGTPHDKRRRLDRRDAQRPIEVGLPRVLSMYVYPRWSSNRKSSAVPSVSFSGAHHRGTKIRKHQACIGSDPADTTHYLVYIHQTLSVSGRQTPLKTTILSENCAVEAHRIDQHGRSTCSG